jgi:hypothetical protein
MFSSQKSGWASAQRPGTSLARPTCFVNNVVPVPPQAVNSIANGSYVRFLCVVLCHTVRLCCDSAFPILGLKVAAKWGSYPPQLYGTYIDNGSHNNSRVANLPARAFG